MRQFITIKKGLCLSLFMLVSVGSIFAQEQDTVQYSTDTTTVAVVQKKIKGVQVKGTVINGTTGSPALGIRVSVEGFSASITDEKGNFTIVVPDYRATIIFLADGFHTRFAQVSKGKRLIVHLYPETFASQFAEVMLPSGTQSLARTVGAISSQNPHSSWSANSETPDSYYQGRLSGVNTIRRSGTPGIGADLFIRGFRSLLASNQPLYVVDGMIYDAASYGTSLTKGHINNPLQHLDIKDIENVTVIKDASGAAIYGTRAANGVVLITTNHAKELATKIDFAVYGGLNMAPKYLPVMNAADYRLYLSDILKSQGLSSAAVSGMSFMNDDPSSASYTKYHNDTDWQKEVFKNTFDKNYSLSVTGGDNIAKYVLSVGVIDDKGIIDSTAYNKYNTRFNADLNLSKKLTATTNLAFSYVNQDLKDQGLSSITNPMFLALVKSPFMNVNEVSQEGIVSPNLSDTDTLGTGNPRSLIEAGQNLKKTYRFSGSINMNYAFNKALKLSILTGLTYDKIQESMFVPRRGVANDTLNTIIADSRLGTQVIRYFSMFNDLRLSYTKEISHHQRINTFLGMRYNTNQSEQDYALGYNSGTDDLISIGNSDLSTREFGGDKGKWNSFSTYGSADYNYEDRYLLNASFSIDGSSRFGKKIENALTINGSKFAVMPAIGAAWVASSEDFLKDVRYIDLLKLRASYGWVGNDDIGNYTAKQYYVSQNLLGLQGLVRGNIANPYLQWEVVRKFNSGVDGAFFNERLSFSLDYWNNYTDKMLTVQTLTSIAGLDSYISNNGAMRSTGLDFGINTRILNKKLKWDAGITLSTYKNKVTRLPSEEMFNTYAGATYITRVGAEANLFYGYKTNGVYATATDALADGLSRRTIAGDLVPFQAGDIRFANIDQDAEGVIDENDRIVIGNPNPDFSGGFTNNLDWNRWNLDALFTFVSGNDIYNYTRAQLESGKNYNNQTAALANRWRGEGQITNTPKATYGDPMGNSRFSDRWIEDGSYIRLRALSLTYSIPTKGKALKYAKVYATTNNVFTLSKYMGYDPEFSASGSVYTQGVDTTLEPQFKSFQLGIRIGL